ncbi:MAG: aldehyde dehydrogenase family protein, partial [Mariprofundaceae bacterium]
MFIAINPATGEEIRRLPFDDAAVVERKIAAACAAQQAWRAAAVETRASALVRLADALDAGADALARTMTAEMGKPIVQARAEIGKCALLCCHVARHGPAMLPPRSVAMEDGAHAWIRFEPLGVLLGIMPWNFPFWQVFRFAALPLLAGNGILIKHAPNVPGCAEALVRLFHAAGIEAFGHLAIDVADVAAVIADARIAGVSLTCSRRAGRAVAELAGRHLKKSVLELGGTDPYLVLEDADIASAAAACVDGRLLNSGQTCIAAKRWIVVDAVYESFRAAVIERLEQAVPGDPMDETTTVGPMARLDLRRHLHAQVERSIAAGTRCVMGGSIPEGPGFHYPVTLLEDVRPGMPAFDEELFGPVAALIRAADADQAVALANRSDYGLGAGVFTRDTARGLAIAERLEAGNVAVNDFVKSDPRLPFGGIKQSGYGRELTEFGLYEFVNI